MAFNLEDAVSKYGSILLEQGEEEIIAVMKKDGYKASEIKKVIEAQTPKPLVVNEEEEDTFGKKRKYEEWRVSVKRTDKGVEAEKLKKLRPCVKITEEQANVLNKGVLDGNQIDGTMYYLPE